MSKQYFLDLLSEPSTWRGIFTAVGGLLTTLSIMTVISPFFIAAAPTAMIVSGLIGSLTKDYKSTDSKVDDIIHAASEAFTEKNTPTA